MLYGIFNYNTMNIKEEVDWLFLQKAKFKPNDIWFLFTLIFYDWNRIRVIFTYLYEKHIK